MFPITHKYVGVNMGSGQRPFTTTGDWQWINIDTQVKHDPPPEIIADCRNLRELIADASVDVVVLHHVLEHFGCGDADAVAIIHEAIRITKSGGCIYISVPDMSALARAWVSGRITDQIYFTNVYGAYMESENDRHRFGYTQRSLRDFLKSTVSKQDRGWAVCAGANPFGRRPIPGSSIAQDWWILEAYIKVS